MDWETLKGRAIDARGNSYSPYSNFPVGAAALTDSGKIVVGSNVENASYGLTLCAECSMISDLFRQGGGKLTHFVCLDAKGDLLMPCGRCRQLLSEHAATGMLLLTAEGELTISQVLPHAFGPSDLESMRTEDGSNG
ncbi:MAG: hypothetical protein RJA35_1153 [Actinomycetota bacterium]|jgi:cytidine deaminase